MFNVLFGTHHGEYINRRWTERYVDSLYKHLLKTQGFCDEWNWWWPGTWLSAYKTSWASLPDIETTTVLEHLQIEEWLGYRGVERVIMTWQSLYWIYREKALSHLLDEIREKVVLNYLIVLWPINLILYYIHNAPGIVLGIALWVLVANTMNSPVRYTYFRCLLATDSVSPRTTNI